MSGSPTSFDAFVLSRGPSLIRFAVSLTGDRGLAEDLVQDALVKIYRRWPGELGLDRPEAYVRRVVVNGFLRWHRRRSSQELPVHVPDQPGGDDADAYAQRDLVWQALAELPRRQRAVLVLRYYEGLPDAEVAALLGCAEGTVRSLAARAFATLRRHPDLARDIALAPPRTEI